MIDTPKITEFWNWFASASGEMVRLYRANESAALAALLRDRVEAIVPGAAWEFGPGPGDTLSFVISPNGDRDRLRRTEQVVSLAPQLDGWTFAGAKPAKQWDFQFVMENALGQTAPVNAAGWRYSLVAYGERSFFDITIYANRMPNMDDAAARSAAGIVLTGALGEKQFIEKIGRIQVERGLGPRPPDRTGNITHLRQHIASLCSAKVGDK